jgi:hypothetical protein
MAKETIVTDQDASSDVHHPEKGLREHHEFAGYDDPHRAALEDNPEHAEKLTLTVILSALFLGTSFTGPIIFGFILVTPILVQLSQKLGGANIDFWIPSGWGAAAAVGFSIAGRLSDIFGRRYVILVGQLMTIVGGAVACSANSMEQLIAGEVLLGASIGTVSVAYAGLSSILTQCLTTVLMLRQDFRRFCRTSIVVLDWRGRSSIYPRGRCRARFWPMP